MNDIVFYASVFMSGAGILLGAFGIYRINRAFKRAAKLENRE
ncbi:MAG: hypothetical protein V7631_1775 [Massilia sp.]|jgi:hypothetical protein